MIAPIMILFCFTFFQPINGNLCAKSNHFCFYYREAGTHIHFYRSLIPIRNMKNNGRNVVTLQIENSKLQ